MGDLPKKTISKLYSCLQTERKCSTTYLKVKWEREAKITLTDDVKFRPVRGIFLEIQGAFSYYT